MASCGSAILYAFFVSNLTERLKTKYTFCISAMLIFLRLTVTIKNMFGQEQKFVIITATCTRLEDGEDVEIPPIKLHLG